MPPPRFDAALAQRRADLREAITAASDELAYLTAELGFHRRGLADPAQRPEAESALRVARAERMRLIREHLDLDLTALTQICGDQQPVLDAPTIASIELLAGLVDHDNDQVLGWLASHQQGPEALLSVVANACLRGKLVSPVDAALSIPVGEQIRVLAQVANTLGPRRLDAMIERRIKAVSLDLRDCQRSAARHARPSSSAPQAVARQTHDRLEALPRVIERCRNAQAWLATTASATRPC